MDTWSNIEVTPDDPEIRLINQLEKALGEIPPGIQKIRELITGFEVCHFKYQTHIQYIRESISNLEAFTDLSRIGTNHIRHGENAWKKDRTGRSHKGQMYVWALREWLGQDPEAQASGYRTLSRKIRQWLGEKTKAKEELVRLLVARLVWDWETYGELQPGEKYKELKYQICRMDVCHYCFPKNIDEVIQGIGKLKPCRTFEGCGSFNSTIKKTVETEFSSLNKILGIKLPASQQDRHELFRRWLLASMAKTLKEQVALEQPVEGLGGPG